jgi:hypothetical protein
MNALKLDTTVLRFRVDAVEPKRDAVGNPVLDRETQQPKFTVHLTVRAPDRARPDQWSVTVVGQPKIAVDQYVTLHNVVAYPWEQGDRHGIALRAEAIAPEGGLPAQAAAAARGGDR